jgi:hypothetical protein
MQLEGEWDVFEGQALTEWDTKIHMVAHRQPEAHTTKFIAIDWGYYRPFSIGWYEIDAYDRLYKYREWYGVKYDEEGKVVPNRGIEMEAAQVGQGIKQRTQENISYVVADDQIWQRHGHSGTIAHILGQILNLPMLKSSKDRKAGKAQIHARLRRRSDGTPGITFSEQCIHTRRTLPGIPVDKADPEDVDKKAECHAYDEARYAAMTQPVVIDDSYKMTSEEWVENFRRDYAMKPPETESDYGLVASYV